MGGRMFPKVRVAMSIATLNGACPAQAPSVLQRRHPRRSGMITHRMGHRRRSGASRRDSAEIYGPCAPMTIFCASVTIFVLRVMAAFMAARPGLWASAER